MSREGFVAAIVIVAAGCTGEAHRSAPTTTVVQTRAKALCERAVPRYLISSEPTTVHEIRTLRIGPGIPNRNAFPRARDEDFAAWCWFGFFGSYTAYGVGPDGTAIELASLRGIDLSAAHGPPAVP